MKKEIGISLEKILYALLIIVPIIPYNKVLPEVINPSVFVILAAMFFIIKNKSFEKKDIFMGGLLILSFISVFASGDKILSLMDSFYFTAPFIIYFIAKNLRAGLALKSVEYVFYGISISAVCSIIRYSVNSDARLDGLLNYANASALLFAVGIIIYYFYLEHTFSQDFNKWRRYFSRIGLVVTITALYLTQSRGGIIVYFAALTFGIVFISLDRKRQIIDICLCNVIGMVFAYTIFSRQFLVLLLISPLIILPVALDLKDKVVSSIHMYLSLLIIFIIGLFAVFRGLSRLGQLSIYNAQLQERLVFYEDAIKIIRNNLLGIGAGNYSSKQYIYQSADYGIKYVHNGFLQIMIDFGIIFFIGFIIIIVYSIVKLYRERKLKSFELLIIMMIFIHSMIDFSMSFIYVNMILFLCMGILHNYELNNIEIDNSGKSAAVNNIFRGISVFIGIVILIFLPGQVVYNISINYADSGNVLAAYNLLSSWKFDIKRTARYYEKLSVWEYELYSKDGDKRYLYNILSHINLCLSINPEDARIYEIKGEICYLTKDYKGAEENLQISKKLRKFYLHTYDELNQCYYTMYTDGKINKTQYDENTEKLKNEIRNLKNYINPKAVYMKNQP